MCSGLRKTFKIKFVNKYGNKTIVCKLRNAFVIISSQHKHIFLFIIFLLIIAGVSIIDMATLTRKIVTCTYSQRLCYLKNVLNSNYKPTTLRSFSKSCFQLSNRRYSEKHEWIVMNSNVGTVGVSHYAQDALGDVVFVQTPEIGQEIGKDDEVGVIESVKAVNEIYSPVSGTITGINEQLADKPSLINESCYDQGWIYKIKLSNESEVDTLMDEDTYQKYLKSIH